jgi:IclR family KDG regulon transcriptional repressor
MLDEKHLKAAIDHMTIQQPTPHTVTDKERLIDQIREIKQQGYAISRGEWINGVVCISVPVTNYTLPLSLSVVGPQSRLKLREKEAIEEIKKSAASISATIPRIFEKQAELGQA